ncbi:cGMP-dependent protein kinase 1-like isoform X2 [Asterias rubens]|uniref:cGMP-dependent protein kinase 1-like isoform X2 n=1 Tax=Asterias rubens TaxID=7604 RepID=UPI001455028A|nr:cGMP-dependent protein kinase 1-like isoform X2 [Asterias rubens]
MIKKKSVKRNLLYTQTPNPVLCIPYLTFVITNYSLFMSPPSDTKGSGKKAAALGTGLASSTPGSGAHSKFVVTKTMGNGAGSQSRSHAPNSQNGKSEDSDLAKLKARVARLALDLREKDTELQNIKEQIKSRDGVISERDSEIGKLREEVHKLRSVLQQRTLQDVVRPDIMSTISEEHGMAGGNKERNKKQGVSGESGIHNNVTSTSADNLQRYEKDSSSRQLIKNAVLENDFTKNFDTAQVKEIVDCMYPMQFQGGQLVIREGDAGAHFYVAAEGGLEVSKAGKVLGKMGPGKVFGELAILYNCTRTATVTAVNDTKIWAIDRTVFQVIMMKTSMQRHEEHLKFLKSVQIMKGLSASNHFKLAESLEVEFFMAGEYIVREGTRGDTFFIITKGSVRVTQFVTGQDEPQEVRQLSKGDYFGEKALLSEDVRTANVIAGNNGSEVLVIDRIVFNELIGNLDELQNKDYGDQERGAARTSNTSEPESTRQRRLQDEYKDIELDDLDIIATLGIGGFGRVEMVQVAGDKQTYALKCLKKYHIVETRQQEHIYSEKKIMMHSNNPFIAKLYKTFTDSKYVYMLMEVCLGGELWTILRDRGSFDDHTARFCIACVVEAFSYLHGKGIVYRDLKPENLLLDARGNVKMVDFGFAKSIGFGRKTWTFCGTPEYVAPEIILNKGHDFAADYWSLGILIFELLTGNPPFTSSDPMKTYNIILKGIDIVEFPKKISRSAALLIKRLCRDTPAERLGYQKNGILDIKKHKWFQGFDWEGLKKQTIIPPILPRIRSCDDASNFDNYGKDLEVPPDELSGWDENF